MATSTQKEIKKWVKQALRQGWSVKGGGQTHWKFYPADKAVRIVVIPSSPRGGSRSYENSMAGLKRSGLDI